MAQVTIKQVRSQIHCPERQKRTLQALGLGRISKTVTVERNPQIDGMIRVVSHLVTVSE